MATRVSTIESCGGDDPEPALDRETVDGITRMLMQIDLKLDLLLEHFGLGDAEDEEEDDA